MRFAPAAMSVGLRRLYAPYAALTGMQERDAPPDLALLERQLAARASRPRTSGGDALRFVAPRAGDTMPYELRIRDCAEVPTRAGDWHDYFNALVWCVFPCAKAAINALHCAELERQGTARRGPLRDALTLFDECGLLVLSSDAALLDGLRAHRWEEVFWASRERLARQVRFLVFGHALLDALRAPFPGLCAKALYREVPGAWFDRPAQDALAEADAWLARWLLDSRAALAPASLAPLPLMGIPELTPDSACAAFYRDQGQFRARRKAGLSGLRCV